MSPPRIFLTGIHGQVGHALQPILSTWGTVTALDRAALDLSDEAAIRKTVRALRPEVIVNPAAYTAVDKAESEPDLAYAINAEAPRILAEEAAALGARMVHYSTDYVFDGRANKPYRETDMTNPLGVYGASKLAGEKAVQQAGAQHLILRTSWVYGAYGKNFLHTIIRLARERDSLGIVSDQIGAPTSSHDIATTTLTLLKTWQQQRSGIYHLTNSGYTSWHGFAVAILQAYEVLQTERGWQPLRVSSEAVRAIATAEYPTPAARPTNSRLDGDLLEQDWGLRLPDWRQALMQVMETPALLG
ncbi:dTDP-4-dehydrorhamnose reductase [Methylovorus menthalis]|uniref:dTDP-4-dehydrorhamnose reductase n=1 Tax=Methylovorus menthalis TaxID=1002227 RepID=UPI001E2BF006|nr:dTDP-4-dehydrorhamnose reductase [Methylovorus menthalis]MCB4811642.1 dTDP-4-dehydrorhamnose reductase [Methylovorus menthalis]